MANVASTIGGTKGGSRIQRTTPTSKRAPFSQGLDESPSPPSHKVWIRHCLMRSLCVASFEWQYWIASHLLAMHSEWPSRDPSYSFRWCYTQLSGKTGIISTGKKNKIACRRGYIWQRNLGRSILEENLEERVVALFKDFFRFRIEINQVSPALLRTVVRTKKKNRFKTALIETAWKKCLTEFDIWFAFSFSTHQCFTACSLFTAR